MTGPDLKPCPFDAGEPKPFRAAPEHHGVRCQSCHAQISAFSTPEKAAEAWNTRATSSPSISDEMVEKGAEALAAAHGYRWFAPKDEAKLGLKISQDIFRNRARACLTAALPLRGWGVEDV